MDKLDETILRMLSRKPESGRYAEGREEKPENALSQLMKMFPSFLDDMKDKKIIDFGCGHGYQAMMLAEKHAQFVVGIDAISPQMDAARSNARENGIENIRFFESAAGLEPGSFDVVISQNSMEHFQDPDGVLKLFRTLIHEKGRVYVSFGPPWYSPYGAHTAMFCKFPWIHLLFTEKTVMKVRDDFTDDHAKRYEGIRGGLNRMSLKKFERLIEKSNFRKNFESYYYTLDLGFLKKIPLLRELLLYHVNVILTPR